LTELTNKARTESRFFAKISIAACATHVSDVLGWRPAGAPARGAGRAGIRGRLFFFEKKNQKTFLLSLL
jgi:hypothetical protein